MASADQGFEYPLCGPNSVPCEHCSFCKAQWQKRHEAADAAGGIAVPFQNAQVVLPPMSMRPVRPAVVKQ